MKKLTALLAVLLLSALALSCSFGGSDEYASDSRGTSGADCEPEDITSEVAGHAAELDRIQSPDVRPVLIAHAGGAVYGMRYTSSLDALESSYRSGFRYMELDFEKTSDGEIVLLHDWESMGKRLFGDGGVKTREEFLESPALSGLKLMDADILGEWLAEHSDAYIITDVKCGNTDVLGILKKKLGNAFKRIIPQVYSFEEYGDAEALGCERIIFTSYASSYTADELVSFAGEKKLWGVTVKLSELTDELLDGMRDADVPVYAHTVNDLGTFEMWREKGLYGIYTDYFTPNRFPYEK